MSGDILEGKKKKKKVWGGGVISVTTIDKRKGRWGILSFFLFCVRVSGIQQGGS